jgi:acetyltransferase
MHTEAITTRRGVISIRPLRDGDTETVKTVFDRLGERSRRFRFGRSLSNLTAAELKLLAQVDFRHRVLVAYSGAAPVGIAHSVRGPGRCAEIAFAVGDEWQRLGIGTALAKLLIEDAAAAGITQVWAVMRLENEAPLKLMGKTTTIVGRRIAGGELSVVGLTRKTNAAAA